MDKKRLTKKRGYDIVVFDCDSTLTKIEGVDWLAKLKGKGKEVEALTALAMNGHLLFHRALQQRLKMIKPTKKELRWLGEQYIENRLPDAREVITCLQEAGKKVYIVTGGYREAVEILAEYLGIKKGNVFALNLRFGKNENYLGPDWENPLSQHDGKREILRQISQQGKTIFVGDGATDLEAENVVDLFVGFGGVARRSIVRKNAPVFLLKPTLKPILNLALGQFIKRSKNVITKARAFDIS
ncbi:MAG: HAD-IB family phosphatase [Candidatus Nealsonbacteria bacterium]|nr:HAD-IB family phosphatase [Candidatus Nealsonbacteria bacterium]